MSTPQGIMRTMGAIGEAFGGISQQKMQEMFGKTLYLDSNKAINEISAGSYWDSLMYGLNKRFIKQAEGGGWEANTALLKKIGATEKEGGLWDISAWNRAKSLAYLSDGNVAWARNAVGFTAGSYLGFNFLSNLTTARHAAGIPYV